MENNQVQNGTNNTVQPVVPTTTPVQPVQPVQAVQQAAPVQPVQAVQQTAPVQPVQNAQTVAPQAPVQSAQPQASEAVQPAVTTTAGVVEKAPAKTSEAFNSQEKVLYEFKPEKESNPIGTAIIFAVLGLGLLCLPFADKLINRGTGPSSQDPIFSESGEIINDSGLSNTFNFEEDQSSIGIGNLELKNFVTGETDTGYKINFTIINNGESAYQYDKKYYMDFYDGESLIYHALIHSYRPIAAKAAAELSLEISEKAYARATSIKLVETKVELYPKYEFDTKDGDYDTLTCTYDKTEIVYYFKDNMLEQIRETYTNDKTTAADFYEKDKSNKQSEINAYRKVQGINANFVEPENEFTAQVDFMLADVVDSTLANLKVYRFFKYHEKVDIIAYEMPATGYMCT